MASRAVTGGRGRGEGRGEDGNTPGGGRGRGTDHVVRGGNMTRGRGNTSPRRGGSLFDRITGGPPGGQAPRTTSTDHAPTQLQAVSQPVQPDLPPNMPPAPNSPIRNSLRRTVILGGSSGRLSRRDQLTEAARQQHMRASLSHDQSPTRIRFFGPYERTSRRDQLTEAIRQQSGPAHLPQATPSEHLVDDRAEPNAGKDEELVPHQDERGELVPVEDENGEFEWVRQALTPSAQGRVGVIRDVEMEDFEGDVDGLGRQHMPEGQEGRQQDSATTGYGAVVGANPETLLDRPEKVPPAIRRFQGPRPPSSSASSPQAQMPPPSSDPSYSHTQQRKLDHWDVQRQQQQQHPVQQATLPAPGTREADAPAERGIAGQSSEFSIRGVADRGRGQGVGNGLRARGRGRGRGRGD